MTGGLSALTTAPRRAGQAGGTHDPTYPRLRPVLPVKGRRSLGDEPLAARLAATAAELSGATVPVEAIDITKQLIVDQLGLQLRGASLPNVAPVARLVAAAGGIPESTVIGTGMRASAPYAAYANGTFGHACQYDDSHQLAWHPGSCVVPSVLALAEREGRTGADVIIAVIAGTQVMAVLGAAATPAMQQLGWHGAKVLGVFGAAVGAGLALGLTVEQLAHAIAIAAAIPRAQWSMTTVGGR